MFRKSQHMHDDVVFEFGHNAQAYTRKVSQNMGEIQPIVASKSGTKYYFWHCSGVKRIKESNRIFFSTTTEAEDAGLQRAANCNE